MSDQDRNANVVLTADTSQYQQSMAQAGQATNQVLQSVYALSGALHNLNQRAGRKLEIIGGGSLAGLSAATVAAGKLQSQMSQLEATATLTGKSFTAYSNTVNDLRRNFSITTDDAVQLVTQLNKMGQAQSQIQSLSETFIRLGAVTGESMSGLVDGLISLQRQMGVVGGQYTEKFASSLANLSQKAGVSAQGILQFANSIAPIGQVAGMTTTDIMGVSTAFNKAGQDGFAAANAFNTMLTQITRAIQYGSPEMQSYANMIGVTVDQFKQMPKSEIVASMFDAITKQGPDAIKTLERFNLDGIRTYKALQGLASQGGIRGSLSDAMEGYQSDDKFKQAASSAMNTLNDELTRMRNNTTAVVEAMGAGLLPAFTILAKAVNLVVGPFAQLLEGLGKIPGLVAAAGAAMTLMGGLLIKNFSRLIGLGSLAAIFRGPMAAGFLNETAPAGHQMAWVRNAAGSYDNAEGGLIQRGLYASGGFMGRRFNDFRAPGAIGEPGIGLGSRLSRAGAGMAHFAGDWMRYGLEPLFYNNLQMKSDGTNAFNRVPFIKAQSAEEFIQNRKDQFRGGYYSLRSHVGGDDETKAAYREQYAALSQSSKAIRETTEEQIKARTVGAALRQEFSMLAGATVKAAAGVTGSTAIGAGRLALRGAHATEAAMNSFFGGPQGLMMVLGTAAFMGHQQSENMGNKTRTDSENMAAGQEYTIALGEAARATTSFADIVKTNTQKMNSLATPTTIASALQISPNDVSAATSASADYTKGAERLGSMNQAQATSYASAVLAGASPADAQLLKMNLIHRFGADTTGQILAYAQNNKLDLTGMFSNIGSQQLSWGPFSNELFTQSGTQQAAQTAGDTARNALTRLQGQQRSQGTMAMFNQAAGAFVKEPNDKGRQQIADAIGRMLLGDKATSKDTDAIYNSLQNNWRRGLTGKDYLSQVQSDLMSGAYSDSTASSLLRAARKDLGGQSWDSTDMPTGALSGSNIRFNNIDESVVARMRGVSALGAEALGKGKLGDAIDNATRNQGDATAQAQAQQALYQATTGLKGGMVDAISELQRLKNVSGTTADAIYQLVAAAQSWAQEQQQYQMHFMTRGGQAQQVVGDMLGTFNNAKKFPGQESAAESKSAYQAYQQQVAGAYDFFKSLVIQERQLATSLQRANDDFKEQRKRSDDQYNLQRQRALDNYNLNRKYAEDDFNLQRQRAQDDFAHQQKLQIEQYTDTVYNAYQRIQVTQSWDAKNLLQNLQEQQQQLVDQVANMKAVRKAGVSGDVIKLLGLDQPQNAQQLARFVEEVQNDPKVVAQYNKLAQQRTSAAAQLMTDKDNTQWQELVRGFNLNSDRGLADFNKGLARQAAAFSLQMSQQETDYNTQMGYMVSDLAKQAKRAQTDLETMVTEETADIDTLAQKAISGVSGLAQKQVQNLYNQLKGQAATVKAFSQTLVTDLNQIFAAAAPPPADLGNAGSANAVEHSAINNASTSAEKSKQYAKVLAQTYGWNSGTEWSALDKLWTQESSWDYTSVNAKSGATGIPQALPGSKMAEVGSDWRTNPITQIKWGLGYIKQVYGDPLRAWEHEQKVGWYGDGGMFTSGPKIIGVGERGPETVLPLNQRGVDFLLAVMKQYSGNDAKRALLSNSSTPMASKTVSYYSRVDKSTNYTGAITVQADDPMAFARKMEADKRLKALTGGGK